MKLKKLTAIVLSIALLITATACAGAAPSSSTSSSTPSTSESNLPEVETVTPDIERLSLKIAALKGPSAIGLLPIIEKNTNPATSSVTANDYEFTIAGAPDQIVGGVISGEYDIAVLPTNLASTVYNKTDGKVKLATINTLGVLYLVETGETVKSVTDLRGKKIVLSGQGSTPEYALDFILRQNGLVPGTDVTVEYLSEHAEVSAMLAAGKADIAVLPQPFLQGALAQNDKLRIALDLTAEWEKVDKSGGSLAMSGIVVQQKLIDEHPEAVEAFLAEYKAATEAVNDPAQLDWAAELAVKHEIIAKAPIAKAAIPQCNIVFLSGSEMQSAASGFLKVLFEANPQSVGGKLPDEGFYYLP